MRGVDDQIVPPHMRHLQRGIGGGDLHHLAFDPVKPRRLLILKALARHHLHADTDPHEGAATGDDRLGDRLEQPAVAAQHLATMREGPVSRQDNPVRLATTSGSEVTTIVP